MEKETECENCGLHIHFVYKIDSYRLNKTLKVCGKCVDTIRNSNLKWEGKAKEAGIQEEIEKLKGVEERRSIREEAEKIFYGKINENKRAAISEKDKEVIFSNFNNACAICSRKEGLHIHHKDHNPSNNKMDNLIVLCGVCHKKIHMKVR